MNQDNLREAFTYSEQEFTVTRKGKESLAKGILIRKSTGLPIRVSALPTGHLFFAFRAKHFYLHRAIWTLHFGEIAPGLVVRHLNNNPMDNTLKNLAIGSQQENKNDSRKYVVRNVGTRWDIWQVSTSVSGFCVSSKHVSQEQARALCEKKVNAILEIIKQTGNRYFRHSPEELRSFLTFDAKTNSFTVTKTPPGCQGSSKNTLFPGSVLKASTPRGTISIQGQSYSTYELSYLMGHGPIPINQTLHHIDFNVENNSPSNLTLLTREENTRLRNGPARFKVDRLTCMTHYDTAWKKFRATVRTEDGKRVRVSGGFETEEAAKQAAKEAAQAVLNKTFDSHVHVATFLKEKFVEDELKGSQLFARYRLWVEEKKIPVSLQKQGRFNFYRIVQNFCAWEGRGKRALIWILNRPPIKPAMEADQGSTTRRGDPHPPPAVVS